MPDTIIAGRTWNEAVLLGTDGFGYATPYTPDTAGTPAIIGLMNDMLSEFGARMPVWAMSTTSIAIGTGVKAFTLAAAASTTNPLRAGSYWIYSAGSPANGMFCTLAADVTSGTALSVTSNIVVGAGTFTDWIITTVNPLQRLYVQTMTGATTAAVTDIGKVFMATSATFTFTLPAAPGAGYVIYVGNIGTGVVTLSASVDGLTYALSQYQWVKLMYTGSVWTALSEGGRGEEAWRTPTLINSWAPYDATNNPVRIMRERTGRVEMRGWLTTGTGGTSAFTNAAADRPPKDLYAIVWNQQTASFTRCVVKANGDVVPNLGGAEIVCLDHLTYQTRA